MTIKRSQQLKVDDGTYYYYTLEGEKLGPYSKQELQQKRDAGEIPESASVQTVHSGNWHLMSDVLVGNHPYPLSRRRHLGNCPRCKVEIQSASVASYGSCPNCGFPIGTPRRVMGIRRHFKYTLKNRYASFRGRATKDEYWCFAGACAFGALVTALLLFVCFQLCMDEFNLHHIKSTLVLDVGSYSALQYVCLGIAAVFCLVCCVPASALVVRRLHDVGRSGVWFWLFMLLVALPVAAGIVVSTGQDQGVWLDILSATTNWGYIAFLFVAAVVLFVLLPLQDSKLGPNKFGPSPKYPKYK